MQTAIVFLVVLAGCFSVVNFFRTKKNIVDWQFKEKPDKSESAHFV
jgi:hypothetical protein